MLKLSLEKGQSVSLANATGEGLTRVVMGLGWDVKKSKGWFSGGGGSIDLDASCLMFNSNGQLLDQVWFQQLRSRDGSIVHGGDNRTGDGDGDDEVIKVDLTRVPADVKTLVFTVNSFTGDTFDRVENAFCRLVDETTGAEVARYNLSSSGPHTAQVMAKVSRTATGWEMTAIGAPSNGRTFRDMMSAIVGSL